MLPKNTKKKKNKKNMNGGVTRSLLLPKTEMNGVGKDSIPILNVDVDSVNILESFDKIFKGGK